MSFPRYPKYKDSGVEWLGEVPGHWEVTALKRVVNPERQITYGIVQAGPHVPDGIPYIRPADMRDEQGVVAPDEVMRTSPEIASGYSRSMIREGDLVCSIGPSFGKVMVTPQWLDGANLTQGTARIAVQLPHDARYLFWTLRSQFSIAQWESSVGGATFRALNLAPLAETTILVPAVAEQTQIAAFLDRETAKIDELVAEQRRLMELLKEKRQAVISHAVTQGLNPHVPMKPSGNKWLGNVPAHWIVSRLKHIKAEAKNAFVDGPFGSNLKSEHFIDNGDIYVIESNFATQGRIDTESLKTISNEHFVTINRSETRGGDIIIAKIGAQYGKASILPTLDKPAVVSGNSLKLTINQKSCDVKFVNWHLANLKELGVMEDIVNATAQPALSLGEMNNLPMLVPPRAEQEAIVLFLNEKLGEFDTLTAEAQRAIDLLQERRTALISAAVTGQIDVRPH